MCLSCVYRNETMKENLLCRDVASIKVENGVVTLTDLFGVQTKVAGAVTFADLTGGTVVITTEE